MIITIPLRRTISSMHEAPTCFFSFLFFGDDMIAFLVGYYVCNSSHG